MCGADSRLSSPMTTAPGSSPRVRSRRTITLTPGTTEGIISACAEQTFRSVVTDAADKDHLRVCGADAVCGIVGVVRVGSSPRVRSRLLVKLSDVVMAGIISACAEQTPCWLFGTPCMRDHLRVCGADSGFMVSPFVREGSSPRVRSRPRPYRRGERKPGIISACAEQTTGYCCSSAE